MTENPNTTQRMREAGTETPASFVYHTVIPHKETFMSKIGYFLTGVIAGATALATAAFLVDAQANAPVGSNPEEEFEQDEHPSAAETHDPTM